MKKTAPRKKTCNEEKDSFKIHMDWGWQVDAIIYTLAANFLLGAATLASIFLRK